MEARDSTVCARFPRHLKDTITQISDRFDMSVSDVVVRFCRDGVAKLGYDSNNQPLKLKNES